MRKASSTFANRIRLLRLARGTPSKALARELGIDPAFLRRIERGIVSAPKSIVRELAKAFHVAEDPLLVMAGHLPEDVGDILRNHPEQALRLLRARFGNKRLTGPKSRERL